MIILLILGKSRKNSLIGVLSEIYKLEIQIEEPEIAIQGKRNTNRNALYFKYSNSVMHGAAILYL